MMSSRVDSGGSPKIHTAVAKIALLLSSFRLLGSIAASIAWESEQVNATRGVKKESEGGGMVRVWKGKGGVES